MKKSYLYFIVPIIATAIFSIFYVRYASGYEERLQIMENKKKAERTEKLKQEADQRDKAVKDAIAATEKRKAEKAARDAKEAAERDARERAVQERSKVHEDERKYEDQVKRLQKDIKENEDQITKIEEDQKQLVQEQGFLRDYVKKAEANTQSLSTVLEKIDAADKARAEAARMAAKKSS